MGYGYDDEAAVPDRAEAERTVNTVASLFATTQTGGLELRSSFARRRSRLTQWMRRHCHCTAEVIARDAMAKTIGTGH